MKNDAEDIVPKKVPAPELNDSYSVGSDDGIDFREMVKRKQHVKKQKKRLPVEVE